MKLLLDENLSRRLVAALQDLYRGTTHLEYVGLDGEADLAICDYAGEHGFVMVTKDVDYDQIIALIFHYLEQNLNRLLPIIALIFRAVKIISLIDE